MTAAVRRMPKASGIVLMYHNVLPDGIHIPAWTIVRESDFRWQMEYLRTHFDIVTMDDALERIAGTSGTSRRFAVVSFDDGYKGVLKTALPILEKLGLPFIQYVATESMLTARLPWFDLIINLLNSDVDLDIELKSSGRSGRFRIPRSARAERRWDPVQDMLTWLKDEGPMERQKLVEQVVSEHPCRESEIEVMNPEELKSFSTSSCVTIGSHTHGHEFLDRLELLQMRETLDTAKSHLTRITGSVPVHLSYPNGNYSRAVMDLVRDLGYRTAVTVKWGVLSNPADVFKIPRLAVGRFDVRTQFKALVAGFI